MNRVIARFISFLATPKLLIICKHEKHDMRQWDREQTAYFEFILIPLLIY